MVERVDCAVIGGGAAGLTAGVYLARFRQSVVVIDDGRSRLADIPRSRNVPGFPEGIEGVVLLARMKAHAAHYGCRFIDDRVTDIVATEQGYVLTGEQHRVEARAVLIATGVDVARPEVDGLAEAVKAGVVRYCPVCDGYEAQGKRIAVLGAKPGSLEEAVFLRTFSDTVTLIGVSDLSDEQYARAREMGIAIDTRAIAGVKLSTSEAHVTFGEGEAATFDVVYPCLGSKPRSELIRKIGADVTPSGGLLVDSRQQTNLPMLYAAGDVLEGLDQIASACGQAAIAATAIHNHLRRE